MAAGNYREYLKGEQVRMKRRRICCAMWGANKKGLAMEFTQVGYPAALRKAAFEVLDSVKMTRRSTTSW